MKKNIKIIEKNDCYKNSEKGFLESELTKEKNIKVMNIKFINNNNLNKNIFYNFIKGKKLNQNNKIYLNLINLNKKFEKNEQIFSMDIFNNFNNLNTLIKKYKNLKIKFSEQELLNIFNQLIKKGIYLQDNFEFIFPLFLKNITYDNTNIDNIFNLNWFYTNIFEKENYLNFINDNIKILIDKIPLNEIDKVMNNYFLRRELFKDLNNQSLNKINNVFLYNINKMIKNLSYIIICLGTLKQDYEVIDSNLKDFNLEIINDLIKKFKYNYNNSEILNIILNINNYNNLDFFDIFDILKNSNNLKNTYYNNKSKDKNKYIEEKKRNKITNEIIGNLKNKYIISKNK